MAEPARVALVGCGDAKRGETVPARDLYTSSYFSLKRQYAEEVCTDWRILSADHGLVAPDARLDPYDTTIDDVDADHWAREVMHDLRGWLLECDQQDAETDLEVVVLAGGAYTAPLKPHLRGVPWPASYPFEDLGGLFDQMGWLSDAVDEA